jgi:hypothetical protein
MGFSDVKMYGHLGDSYGLISYSYIDPSTNFGVIFITNGPKNSQEFKVSDKSSFYEPEADTFDTVAKYSRPKCI